MPKRWSEVEANPAYQSLAPEQKAKAQEQYFNQVVAPAVGPAKVEAARSQFMARANKAPVQSEGPGMMERMGQGALAGAVPGVSTYKAVKEHGLGTDAAAALGGDVANVAMLGLAGPGKLLQQTALGAGMGAAGGALAPVAQKMGEMGRGAAESVFGTAQDSPSVLMNMIRNAPGTIGETLGELAPQLGIAALTGKIAKGMSKGPAPLPEAQYTPKQLEALDLQSKGYPVTESHGVAGDIRLKNAMMDPKLAAESGLYQEKLGQAMRSDLGQALGNGQETTQTLGEKAKGAFNAAKGERSNSFREMLGQAENPRGPEMTGVGELTHAGKEFAKTAWDTLAERGVKVTPELKMKALVGEGLTQYDVPAGVNPADVSAILKFADLASQKAPSAVDLNNLARDFAKNESLFREGKASGSGFKRDVQNKATDLAGDLIQKRDSAMGLSEEEGAYKKWAEQRANWAKSADLVDEFRGKMSSPETRLTGEKMYSGTEISPEQLFTKEFKNASVNKVEAFKEFLKSNKQDPAIVENMAKDWLNDIGNKSDPQAGFNAIAREWEGMSPEKKNAFFSQETQSAVNDALKRGRSARSPLEVMGTQAKGGSQTHALGKLKDALDTGGGAATVGAGIGGVVGGFPGSALGGIGGALWSQAKAAKATAANAALLKGEASFQPVAPKSSMMRTAQVSAAPIAQRISNLPRNQVVSQSVLGTTRAQAAEKAKKLSRVGR